MTLKKRIIPVLLLKDGDLVQSRKFRRYNKIGNFWSAAKRISSWSSDELIYIDISNSPISIDDRKMRLVMLDKIASEISVPLSYGGRIRSLSDARELLKNGADKIVINSLLHMSNFIVEEIVQEFGSQAVVASIDALKVSKFDYECYASETRPIAKNLLDLIHVAVDRGCGEILINAIERDGTGLGFDIDLINLVCDHADLPVIALGGAGNWEHFEAVIDQTYASGIAAANIFHHSENSVYACRKFLASKGLPVRLPLDLSTKHSLL